MPAMANQIKNALEKYIFKHPYRIPSQVLDAMGAQKFVLREYFHQKPALNAVIALAGAGADNAATLAAYTIANKNFEVLGTNMTTALCTLAAIGGITLTTAGASADQAIVLPHLDTNQTAWSSTLWSTDKSPTFETVIETGANVTAATIWAGFKLTNTSVVATDDDQCFFRYQDTQNSGGWQIITSRSNVDTTTNVAVGANGSVGGSPAVAVSTRYRLRIAINAARQPRFWINDVEVLYNGPGSVFPALTTGINLIPYIGVQAGAAAAKAVTVRGLVCSRT